MEPSLPGSDPSLPVSPSRLLLVPQGSLLSPISFNILLSDLHLPPHSHLLVYADDITILSRAPTLAQTQLYLQEAATSLEDWMSTWGLSVSVPKSTIMCFSMKRLPSPPTLTLLEQTVSYVPHLPGVTAGWPPPLLGQTCRTPHLLQQGN